MAQLAITNIINVSVSQIPTGINEYNTSNLAIFTTEAPNLGTFGNAGYAIYLTSTQVGIDFGTSSRTYQMAVAIFAQSPNILTGNGELIVILQTTAIETIAFSGVAASGAIKFTWGGNTSASISYSDTASQIQTILQAMPGLSEVTVTGTIPSESVVIQMNGVYGESPSLFTFTSNTLLTSASGSITPSCSVTTMGESINDTLVRTQSLVQYFGIVSNVTLAIIGQSDMLAAAATIQTLNKIGFFVSYTGTDIQPGGMLTLLASGNFSQTRGLYYGDSTVSGLNAVLMAAAYAGRALSVNFDGSNTTQTMHLKQLATIQPDPTMTQTILNNAITAGADSYPSLQGVPAVFCTSANTFFDRVYNLQWFVGAIQVAGFNYLQQTSTKVPQTEAGMDGLKGAYQAVCAEAVANQYLAPGTWNGATTFGNQQSFVKNIQTLGYYIFSTPVGQQSQTNRAARQAPLVQIAVKEAGAIQSSQVAVYVNA